MTRPSARRMSVAVPGLLTVALTLSGCGSGLKAQTYQQRTASDATNEAIGALAIRNLSVLPPGAGEVLEEGQDARASIAVISEDPEQDRLVSVRTDVADSVEIVQQNRTVEELVVPPLGYVDGYLKLNDLTRDVRTGQYITVELAFERNGRKEMLVPVAVSGRPSEKREGYHPAELDSNGDPIVEDEEEGATGEKPEGEDTSEPSGAGAGPATEPRH